MDENPYQPPMVVQFGDQNQQRKRWPLHIRICFWTFGGCSVGCAALAPLLGHFEFSPAIYVFLVVLAMLFAAGEFGGLLLGIFFWVQWRWRRDETMDAQ